MTVRVYGASDDLIEVEGDIREEFPYTSAADDDEEGGRLLAFSNGVVLRITYSVGGVWRIQPMSLGHDEVEVEQAPEDDEDNHSDHAIVKGDVRWVVVGHAWARR